MHLGNSSRTIVAFALIIGLVAAVPANVSTMDASAQEAAAATAKVTISGEPLVLSDESITRSFSYPIMEFLGETTTLTVTITWNTDGSTVISDNRGYRYTIGIPESQGNIFSLWSNSTVVAQRVVGVDLQYDVYWTAVAGEKGYVEKYKYTIVGTSANGTTLSFVVDGGENDRVQGSKFIAPRPASGASIDKSMLGPSLDWTPEGARENPAPEATAYNEPEMKDEGLGLDWLDAIDSGYQATFNHEKSALEIPVGKSFFIDPTTVATSSLKVSPLMTETFEGEKRTVSFGNTTFAFYYDGSNVRYKTSTDYGKTWGSSISTGSGVVRSDYHRWTLVTVPYQNVSRIVIVYWTPDGTNMNFKSVRGTVSGSTVSWDSPVLIGYTWANSAACGSGGGCAASTATTDSAGNIYAAFTWLAGGATQYSYKIMKSTNAGSSWSFSLNQVSSVSNNRPTMALTTLNSTKLLFVYGLYELSELKYRVFDGTNWGSVQTTSGAGMPANVRKQISAASNSTQTAFVAFTSGGVSGSLKAARFSNTGSFQAFETADSTLSHSLPSIIITRDDTIHIFSLGGSSVKIHDTRKFNNTWQGTSDPFRTTFSAPDQLTAEANNEFFTASALWTEGSSPNTIKFGTAFPGIVVQTNNQVSPSMTESYAGERRIANMTGTLFTFYYDGSNIVYKTSTDGSVWSNATTSTGTGQIGADNYRWSLLVRDAYGSNRITLLYYKPSGDNTNFYAKTFTASGAMLTLVSTDNLFSVANDASCGSSVCAAASGTVGSDDKQWAVYRYKTGGTWYYRVFNSSDGGDTWTSSLGPVSVASFTSNPFPITLTPLASGKMLLVLATYESSTLRHRAYDGSSWGSTVVLSGTGMTTNNIKQISADSNSTGFGFVAYVTGGTSGTFKIARFSGTGTFQAFETVDDTMSHSLPSITVNPEGTALFYSLSGGKVRHIVRVADDAYTPPNTPYGNAYDSPDQLTAGVWYAGTVWREGSASPYILRYSGIIKVIESKWPPCDHFAQLRGIQGRCNALDDEKGYGLTYQTPWSLWQSNPPRYNTDLRFTYPGFNIEDFPFPGAFVVGTSKSCLPLTGECTTLPHIFTSQIDPETTIGVNFVPTGTPMLITASFVYFGGLSFYEITVYEELPGYTLPS